MSVFCSVVETGAFSRAARALGISTTAASRHVKELEKDLGVKLIQRSTRHLMLTHVGREYYHSSLDILERIQQAENNVRIQGLTPKGLLRVGLSYGFGQAYATSVLFKFKREYPELVLEIIYSDHTDDLVHEGLDLSIRVAGKINPTLIARRLTEINLVCCASPDYLKIKGVPKEPADLKKHECLTYSYASFGASWTFYQDRQPHVVHVGGSLQANSGQVLRDAACDGLGVILLPEFHVQPDLVAGTLVPVLGDYQLEQFSAYAVYEANARKIAKIKILVDFLSTAYSAG